MMVLTVRGPFIKYWIARNVYSCTKYGIYKKVVLDHLISTATIVVHILCGIAQHSALAEDQETISYALFSKKWDLN